MTRACAHVRMCAGHGIRGRGRAARRAVLRGAGPRSPLRRTASWRGAPRTLNALWSGAVRAVAASRVKSSLEAAPGAKLGDSEGCFGAFVLVSTELVLERGAAAAPGHPHHALHPLRRRACCALHPTTRCLALQHAYPGTVTAGIPATPGSAESRCGRAKNMQKASAGQRRPSCHLPALSLARRGRAHGRAGLRGIAQRATNKPLFVSFRCQDSAAEPAWPSSVPTAAH